MYAIYILTRYYTFFLITMNHEWMMTRCFHVNNFTIQRRRKDYMAV